MNKFTVFYNKTVFANIKVRHFLGVIIGAVGGFLYYHFIGCATGTCPLTSNPYIMMSFGGVFGLMLTSEK